MEKIKNIILVVLIGIIIIAASKVAINVDSDGNVNIGGNLTLTGTLSVPENHGSFGFQDSAFVVAATEDNWFHVTNANNDLWQIGDEDNVSISNDTMATAITGHWDIIGGVSFNGAVNDIWSVAVFVNGSQVGFHQSRKTSNNDTGYIGFGGTFDLTAGDEITIEVMNSENNNDYTAVSAWINISFIHR